ncbi:hypothetical protein PUNSTDRAFT_41688 [Punctularia strigosozonata HHB-11173 SS5]|uniref:uncharacterized protein n=1 Tax=Punctularia strigosozonata (strain HHB-11173) TaxID=741275 RepID=UPI0004417D70|nr:uncharacterized protein PUNSTDRAFT_41688 [Punctularia strigosozonata HHB-11173 SS5]EIN14493.1 hypothetical protein PUNSTDRAFT_41688 [Punctularia strigosozonata HHB-11173 SS5]
MELWNCVNRHVLQKSPKEGHDSRGKRITLILAHANGFPKEIWEPTLQSLISHSESADYIIEEIWSWEAVQHGDSALINAKALSGVHDWADNSRDILNFLINYMPSAGSDESLPTHLNPVEPSVSAFRAKSGFSDRTLVAIGHSYGGTTSAFAALTHPWLFSAIILIDPIINPASDYGEKYVHHLVAGAIKRRNGWSSRAEALEQFKRIPFFAAWEPAVLQRYIDFGLYEDRKGQFQLKMTPIQEAVAFVETRLSAKVWDLMPLLDEQVALHWVKPARLLSIPGLRTKEESEKIAQELVWLRPANASNTILPTGHLVPHESPSSLAQDLHLFLVKKYGRSVRYHSNAKL